MGVEGTAGLSAGRSLALGSSVWADRKEQLPCRAGQGQLGAGRGRRRLHWCSQALADTHAVSACARARTHTHTHTHTHCSMLRIAHAH